MTNTSQQSVVPTTDGMLDPELKAKWLEALRGGKYKQGRQYLKTEDRYCCLGVLCDVVDRKAWTGSDQEAWAFEDEGYKQTDLAELPANFRRSIGMDNSDMAELIAMNDEQCSSFDEIADWIEANL